MKTPISRSERQYARKLGLSPYSTYTFNNHLTVLYPYQNTAAEILNNKMNRIIIKHITTTKNPFSSKRHGSIIAEVIMSKRHPLERLRKFKIGQCHFILDKQNGKNTMEIRNIYVHQKNLSAPILKVLENVAIEKGVSQIYIKEPTSQEMTELRNMGYLPFDHQREGINRLSLQKSNLYYYNIPSNFEQLYCGIVGKPYKRKPEDYIDLFQSHQNQDSSEYF